MTDGPNVTMLVDVCQMLRCNTPNNWRMLHREKKTKRQEDLEQLYAPVNCKQTEMAQLVGLLCNNISLLLSFATIERGSTVACAIISN